MKNILLFYFFPVTLLAAIGIGMSFFSWILMTLIGTKTRLKINVTILIISVFIALSIAETGLRMTGTFANYVEKRSGVSWSPFDCNHDNVLWNRDPLQEYNLRSDEFTFHRKANSLGFTDKELLKTKDANELRILCLGDSYTEGDGCPYDSSYPRQMERIIQSHYPDKKITVINAGICGSDPIFGYKDYDSLFYQYSPDIVIQSMDELDFFDDIASRGGFERFATDGKVYFANPSVQMSNATL